MAKIIQTAELAPDQPMTPNAASWIYNGLDCCITNEVHGVLTGYLDDTTSGVYRLSKALQGPILDMSMRGLLVDQRERKRMLDEIVQLQMHLQEQLDEIVREGYNVQDFNWSSPKQLSWFLYEYLKLPPKRKRGANGKMTLTTDRMALEGLQHYLIAAPLIKHILAIRDLSKRAQFLKKPLAPSGRLPTSLNIAGTNTGRLSSAHDDFGDGDNLQNVDRKVRRTFIAPKGKKLANLDLEQADSRNVGATCWNRFVERFGEDFAGAYLDACESGDLHTMVTRMSRPELPWPEDEREWRAFADAPQEIFRGKSFRDTSKNWGHGSNYMLTAASAVKKVPGVTVKAAEEFKERYFEAFPCIPAWHKDVQRDLNEYGFLTTIWGRRRFFFGRPNDSRTLRAAVAYEGQSATADEINYGLLNLWRGGKRFPGFQLLIQVHDSILFEYDEVCEDEIIPWALEALKVPLELKRGRQFIVPTEAKVGWNWGDAAEDNPDGMVKWKGGDARTRTGSTSFTPT